MECAYCKQKANANPGSQLRKTLRWCSGCRRVKYCNVDCQRAHWKIHKHDCREISKITLKSNKQDSPFHITSFPVYDIIPPFVEKGQKSTCQNPHQNVKNVIILFHDSYGDYKEMANFARNMKLSHFYCVSIQAHKLEEKDSLTTQSTTSREPSTQKRIRDVDDNGPWFSFVSEKSQHSSMYLSNTAAGVRLIKEIVGLGFPPRGVFLLGIGQGGMAAMHIAIAYACSPVLPPLKSTNRTSVSCKQQLGAYNKLGGVIVIHGTCILPEARQHILLMQKPNEIPTDFGISSELSTTKDSHGETEPSSHHSPSLEVNSSSAPQSSAIHINSPCDLSLLPSTLVSYATLDDTLPRERVESDTEFLKRECKMDIRLFETSEPALLSATCMKEIYTFLSNKMYTALHEMAYQGEVIPVTT